MKGAYVYDVGGDRGDCGVDWICVRCAARLRRVRRRRYRRLDARRVPYGYDLFTKIRASKELMMQSPQGGEIVVTAYNGKYHDQIVAGLTSTLRAAGVQVANEFTICIVDATTCARADIFGRDPKSKDFFVVEVKTGPGAKFTGNQLLVYPHIEEGGLVYSPDPRANDFSLVPGEPLPSIYGYE